MKIPSEIIIQRLEELKTAVNSKNFNQASKRILDFFSDFELSDKLMEEAVKLRQQFNLYDSQKSNEKDSESYQTIVENTQELLAEIQSELEDNTLYHNIFKMADQINADSALDYQPTNKYFVEKFGKQQTVFRGLQISKTYNSKGVKFKLPPLDLELKLGELTGVVGENGNGKTTLLRMLAGDLAITEGKLAYPAITKEQDFDWYSIKQDIAYIPQRIPKWHGFLRTNLKFHASINGIRGKENEKRVNFVIHRLGLSKYQNAKWSEISSGYKLRFELAKALVWQPKLLVLDEPLANLDINAKALFLQDLKFLTKSLKHPISVIISSQQLHEVESVVDRIIFLKNGEALFSGSLEQFGEDRTENIFELEANVSIQKLNEILTEIDSVKVKNHANNQLIYTPIEVKSAQILRILAENEVEVSYFREISQSTKKLFLDSWKEE